jgi:C4-dicarboxylate-specific signal transduction histidine kinase
MGARSIFLAAFAPNALAKWTVVCAIYLVIVTATAVARAYLLKGLEVTFQKEKQTGLILAEEHRKAKWANPQLEQEMIERKNAQKELKKEQERLIRNERMSAIGEWVAGVAHEISTPVGVGLTASSFLHDQTVTDSERFDRDELKRTDLQPFRTEFLITIPTSIQYWPNP